MAFLQSCQIASKDFAASSLSSWTAQNAPIVLLRCIICVKQSKNRQLWLHLESMYCCAIGKTSARPDVKTHQKCKGRFSQWFKLQRFLNVFWKTSPVLVPAWSCWTPMETLASAQYPSPRYKLNTMNVPSGADLYVYIDMYVYKTLRGKKPTLKNCMKIFYIHTQVWVRVLDLSVLDSTLLTGNTANAEECANLWISSLNVM